MCNHADQTNEFIQHLLKNVYPCLDLKLQNAINCDHLNGISSEKKDYLLELMNNLRNDFSSLVTCEEKLVFPSVMKVFNAKTIKDVPLPNLIDLMQLTRSKEHKIMSHVNDLATLLETSTWVNTAIKQHALANAFLKEFVHEKYRWNKMIEDRLNSCNCFRSNIYKGLGLDPKTNHSSKQV